MKMKPIPLFMRIVFPCMAIALSAYLLYRYDYFGNFLAVDNPLGMLPIVLLLCFIAGMILLCIVKWQRPSAFLTLTVGTILALALFPNAVQKNWWLQKPTEANGDTPDITIYAPHTPGNATAKLDHPASLTISEDFPVMDGALALYPVYAAVADAVYDKATFDPNAVMFTNTLRAYDGIIAGERDVIFCAGPSKSQRDAAAAAGVDLVLTPIGKEAFVFLVGRENPIDDLSVQQIHNIYSGKTSLWGTLGWREGGEIIAFQRPDGSGSQTGLETVMGDLPIIAPQPLPNKALIGSNSLMQQVSVRYRGVQPALGYSFRFFAQTMFPNPDAKLLKIDGIEPTNENIRSGLYPYTMYFYAVTNGEPKGNTKRLIDWLVSAEGQSLIKLCGYAPLA